MGRMTKDERAAFDAKLDAAVVAADDATKDAQRLGSLTPENCQLIALLVEDIFHALPGARVGEYLGHLNEILCYLSAVKRAQQLKVEKS